jgi:glucose/arabinose dehydrogenase/mono/diheme cytochrome c family protein
VAVRAYPRLEFARPIYVAAAPGDGDHLHVVEQAGRILRFEDRDDVGVAEVVLDIRARVRMRHDEEGLLGLAFAPDYEDSGVFYLYYSASNPRRVQISRFRRGPHGQGDPDSEEVLLTVEQPYGNHNGGALVFGPDGHLYAGFGDGGAAGDPLEAGQDLSTLLGSIVRLEVASSGAYRVPLDNPFVDRKGARPEIWAYGLRNPWRVSFDRQTGTMWAGDVGQDRHEEIDIIERGGNYGWSRREGNHDFRRRSEAPADPLRPAVIDYPRSEGQSVTGGYVYRGLDVPALRGSYVYGDYVSGNVWALRVDSEGGLQSNDLVARVSAVSSFGEDGRGELLAVSLSGGLYRFAPARVEDAAPGFPTRLSETGLFMDTAALVPHPRLREYVPRVELWSDGASKRRWLALPPGTTIDVTRENEAWSFPVGTVTVKHFELPDGRRLETRVMVHERAGWAGYTYRWTDAQTDAHLLMAPATTTYTGSDGTRRRWTFPFGADCFRCHTPGYGRVLGIRTRQLAGTEALDAWAGDGLFGPDAPGPVDADVRPGLPRLADATQSNEDRARAYLDVNCAVCHHRGGPAPGGMDLRIGVAVAHAGIVGIRAEAHPERVRLAPGDPDRSDVLLRMRSAGGDRMPPLASGRVDTSGAAVIAAWISELGDPQR